MTAQEAKLLALSSCSKEVEDVIKVIKEAAQNSQTSIKSNLSDAAVIALRQMGFIVSRLHHIEHYDYLISWD